MSNNHPFHTWNLQPGLLRLSRWSSDGSEVVALTSIRLDHVSAISLSFGPVQRITLTMTSGATFEVVADPEEDPALIVDLFDRLEQVNQ